MAASRLLATLFLFILAFDQHIGVAGESSKAASSPNLKVDKELMNVLRVKEQPSVTAPAENFTGSVRVTRLVQGEDPSNLTCGYVTFQPGSRSNWHTHPKGQLLIVTEGEGLIQEWGEPLRRIVVGDVIWTPPNKKHWHGATPGSAMTHAAVTETLNGKAVDWLERVTDTQYKAKAQ